MCCCMMVCDFCSILKGCWMVLIWCMNVFCRLVVILILLNWCVVVLVSVSFCIG